MRRRLMNYSIDFWVWQLSLAVIEMPLCSSPYCLGLFCGIPFSRALVQRKESGGINQMGVARLVLKLFCRYLYLILHALF